MAGDPREKIFEHGAMAAMIVVGLSPGDRGADADQIAMLFSDLHGSEWSVDHILFRMRSVDGKLSTASFEMSKPGDYEALSGAVGLL